MKEKWRDFFKGKKVTQMGLGLLGRGIQDAVFLAEAGVEVVVTDLKTKEQLEPSLKKLTNLPTYQLIDFHLGGHRLEDFRGRDFILKSAGVPLDSPYIAEARKNGIPIEMDASLFCKLAPEGVTTIGVTGTRGKSTVTQLIYEILQKRFKVGEPNPNIYLGGNVRDTATLPLLKKVNPGDFVVLELDSWQLQGFGDSKISPDVAVFTTFYSDHMNYYGSTGSPQVDSTGSPQVGSTGSPQVAMDRYFEDKANIFRFKVKDSRSEGKKENTLIVGEQAASVRNFPERAMIARADDVPPDWVLKIPGEHNRANVACAVAAARAMKIPDEIIKVAVENFKGLPGRLEFLRGVNGVKIYNDTNSTTPEATLAALRAINIDSRFPPSPRLLRAGKIQDSRKIILIMGGADKQLNMSELLEEIPKHCKAVVLLPGTGTEKLISNSLISNSPNKISNQRVQSLHEAVQKCMEVAESGDVLLFSPAFASFGPPPGGFKNEYDRGEQFVKLVDSL